MRLSEVDEVRCFWDFERLEVVTIDDLLAVWNDMMPEEQADHNFDFDDYVEACQDYNNGTLEEIEEDKVKTFQTAFFGEYMYDRF